MELYGGYESGGGLHFARAMGRRLWAYRASCSIALIVALALMISDQFTETLIVNAEELQEAGVGFPELPDLSDPARAARLYLPVIMLSLLPNFLWMLAGWLHRVRRSAIAPPGRLVLVICSLPQAALLWQLYGFARGAENADGLRTHFWWLIGAIILLYILFLLAFRSFEYLLVRIGAWAITAGLVYLLAMLVLEPSVWGPRLGPLPVLALFGAMLATVGAVANWLEDERGIPLTLALVAAAIGFSWLDWNDNHFIRQLDAALPEAPPDPGQATRAITRTSDLEMRFLAWLDCRPGYAAARARGETFPVLLVAAQGGGLYAAYQSASFLADMQDANPGFAGRIFAMSGVSGGAVGVTVFSALIRDLPPRAQAQGGLCGYASQPAAPAQPYRNAVETVLKQDYLSPVGAALLFPDFLARFSPRPVPSADRARAMERAFERNYRAAVPETAAGLEETVFAHWNWRADAPMLLLNTTDVSTGTRMLTSSPLRDFPADRIATFRQLTGCDARGDGPCTAPRLSTAMLLSARFPLVTPAGSIALPSCGSGSASLTLCDPGAEDPRPKARFVDGGYYENSGLDTVADLIEALGAVARERQVEFIVLSFESSENLYPGFPARAYGLGEIGSPLRALNNARSARIHPARARVEDLGVFVFPVLLETRYEPYTLGWLLSERTFKRIDDDLYDPETCAGGSTSLRAESALAREENCRTRSNLLNLGIEAVSRGPTR